MKFEKIQIVYFVITLNCVLFNIWWLAWGDLQLHIIAISTAILISIVVFIVLIWQIKIIRNYIKTESDIIKTKLSKHKKISLAISLFGMIISMVMTFVSMMFALFSIFSN